MCVLLNKFIIKKKSDIYLWMMWSVLIWLALEIVNLGELNSHLINGYGQNDIFFFFQMLRNIRYNELKFETLKVNQNYPKLKDSMVPFVLLYQKNGTFCSKRHLRVVPNWFPLMKYLLILQCFLKKKRLLDGYFRIERISMSESLERRLRIRLVGNMEKWDDRKLWEYEKVRG